MTTEIRPGQDTPRVPVIADSERVAERPQSAARLAGLDVADEEPEHKLAFSCPVDHEGTAVFVQGWTRAHSDQPPLIFVHDLAENVELYEPAARELLRHGFNTYSFDMRGHGRTTPLAGKMLAFDDLIKDLLQVVAWIRYKSQRRVPILIGQGVGALLILYFQRNYPQYCRANVLLAPVFQEQSALSFLSRSIIQVMSLLAPKARLPRFLLPYFLPMTDDVHVRESSTALMISAGFAQDLLRSVHDPDAIFRSQGALNLVISPIDDRFYKSAQLENFIQAHSTTSQFELRRLSGVTAQAWTSEPQELVALLAVVIPWLKELAAPN